MGAFIAVQPTSRATSTIAEVLTRVADWPVPLTRIGDLGVQGPILVDGRRSLPGDSL